jgi:hypothetical protein
MPCEMVIKKRNQELKRNLCTTRHCDVAYTDPTNSLRQYS